MTQVRQHQMKNGLRVITKPMRAMPVVSVYTWYRVGAKDEPPGASGLAHFLEHMLFKGTQAYPKGEISRLIERTGGQQNAFTSYDYTAYYETVPSAHLDQVLHIHAERMSRALLDAREVERERTVILSELDGNRNHPHVRFRDLLNAHTWNNHPYRRPVIGWREEVEQLSRSQLEAFYRMHYAPSNAALVVVGDFDAKALHTMIERRFGAMAFRREPVRPRVPRELPGGMQRIVMEDHGPTPMLQVNIHIPPAGHPDQVALAVLNDILVKGKTARLYRALVDRGLATDVYAAPYEMIDPGVWTLKVMCPAHIHPQDAEAAVLEVFAQVREKEIYKHECQKAVNQTKAELVFSNDSITDQAMLLGFYQTVANDWRIPERLPGMVAKVDPPAIRAAAQKYLKTSNMVIGHFLPYQAVFRKPSSGKTAIRLPAELRRKQPGAKAVKSGSQVRAGSLAAKPEVLGNGCHRYTLSNGTTLLVHPNPGNPMVVLSGLVRGGMAGEPVDKPGIALLHAHMLDRGNAWRDVRAIAQELEFRGCQLVYGARREELQVSGEALTGDLPMLMEILGHNFRTPLFPDAELRKVRHEVLTLCRHAQQSSEMQAWQHFYDMAYPANHPMRRSLLTVGARIPDISRKDLIQYHRTALHPGNAVWSFSGDVDPETVRRLAEKHLAPWQGTGQPDTFLLTDMAPVRKTVRHTQQLPGKHESIVVLGHQGPHRSHPDYYAAMVANQILGGAGFSALLMQEVRDKAGLTYSIYSQFRVSRGNRPWCIVFQADPGNVEKALAISRTQVKRLQQGRFHARQLADTKERLVGQLAMSMETNTGIAHLNREIENHRLGDDYLREYAQQVGAVSRARVIAAANTWFHPDALIISIAAPEK